VGCGGRECGTHGVGKAGPHGRGGAAGMAVETKGVRHVDGT